MVYGVWYEKCDMHVSVLPSHNGAIYYLAPTSLASRFGALEAEEVNDTMVICVAARGVHGKEWTHHETSWTGKMVKMAGAVGRSTPAK